MQIPKQRISMDDFRKMAQSYTWFLNGPLMDEPRKVSPEHVLQDIKEKKASYPYNYYHSIIVKFRERPGFANPNWYEGKK